jgi:hypothetical protein
MPTKNYFVTKFFCLLLFEGTFTSFFKDKKSFFLLILLGDRRIRIWIHTREAQKHVDPVDLDPNRNTDYYCGSPVVKHDGAQSKEPLQVHSIIHLQQNDILEAFTIRVPKYAFKNL